jgi:TonB family protein
MGPQGVNSDICALSEVPRHRSPESFSRSERTAPTLAGRIMTSPARERPDRNPSGFLSPTQQAELDLLLAGHWPPLKPLPIFKLETDDYRAAIDFDKIRGDWLCRKTSLLSNMIEELRGSLPEILTALPGAALPSAASPSEVAQEFAQSAAAEPLEQESQKDATRRLQAFLAWRENYENGAFYYGLQTYLSGSQQAEVAEIIRLTLTARQLQCSPTNIAYVFDALAKAGGRLATLVEIAQRNKMQQGMDASAIEFQVLAPEVAAVGSAPMEIVSSATVESLPQNLIASAFPELRQQTPERFSHAASQAAKIMTPLILDAREDPPSFDEDFLENVCDDQVPAAVFASQPGTPRSRVLEISGAHIAAAVFLLAVITFAFALSIGRISLGKHIGDTQESTPIAATSPSMSPSVSSALPDRSNQDAAQAQGNTIPQLSAPPAANSLPALAANPPANVAPTPPSERTFAQLLPAPSADATAPAAAPKPAPSLGTISPKTVAPANPAQRWAAPARRAAPHISSPSTILVTGPGNGSKPFRLTLPEKPIAASSSFAMTSQLSVLVPPAPGPASAHKPARLEAGELVSFVWPSYPGPGDRYGSAETVRVRTTIGKLGQVLDVKLVSGSTSLLPAARSAIRQWRYRPTLLNKMPVLAQQDVTIEFRPPQYLSHVSTQRPPHN